MWYLAPADHLGLGLHTTNRLPQCRIPAARVLCAITGINPGSEPDPFHSRPLLLNRREPFASVFNVVFEWSRSGDVEYALLTGRQQPVSVSDERFDLGEFTGSWAAGG